MSPTPKEVRSDMLSDVEGRDLIKTAEIIQNLAETPAFDVDVPDHRINKETYEEIGISSARLILGTNFLLFCDHLLKNNLIPRNPLLLEDQTLLEEGFSIQLSFIKNPQQLIQVSRKYKKSVAAINFQHSGTLNPIREDTLIAIMGLACVPDKYWKNIESSGLVVGSLIGNYYQPWTVEFESIMLPDPEGILTYRGNNNGLIPFSPDDISRILKNQEADPANEIITYFKSLKPVGLFSDLRQKTIPFHPRK